MVLHWYTSNPQSTSSADRPVFFVSHGDFEPVQPSQPCLPLRPYQRPRHPHRSPLRRNRRRIANTSARFAPGHSVGVSIGVDMKDRVSFGFSVPDLSRWRGCSPLWWGRTAAAPCAHLLADPPLFLHRHQRATLQMSKVSKHLRSSRPPATTRSHRTCQRWRGTARQRSQEAAGRKGHTEGHTIQAIHRAGHGDVGTDRTEQ